MIGIINEKRKTRMNVEKYHLFDKATMIDALTKQFGPLVIETIKEARGVMMEKIWQQIAENAHDNSIDTLIENLWSENFFDFTISKNKEGKVQMNVTWCLFAEIAKECNLQTLAFQLYCVDDPHIVKGFNPKMGFKRTKTLMEGHNCCDHCYWMTK